MGFPLRCKSRNSTFFHPDHSCAQFPGSSLALHTLSRGALSLVTTVASTNGMTLVCNGCDNGYKTNWIRSDRSSVGSRLTKHCFRLIRTITPFLNDWSSGV